MRKSKIELHNVDCLPFMKQCEDNQFDLAIVDPPYGFRTEKTGILNFRKGANEKVWNVAPTAEYFDELKRVSKNQIVWGGDYFPELWVNGCRCFIYWHKGNPVPNFADGELAWTSFDQNAKQCDYRYYGNLEGKTSAGDKFHPTQKPVALYEWLLQNYAQRKCKHKHNESERYLCTDCRNSDVKIFDSHLGSGSIAIACHNLGFDLTACELDKEYFDSANKRIQQHVSQQRLF